jgi:hypothetical protein
MSSKELARLLEKGGAIFVRQGSTDHAIYSRMIEGKRYSTPVQMGKKSLQMKRSKSCWVDAIPDKPKLNSDAIQDLS